MSDTALDRLRDRAQQRAFAGRSDAYRWLWRRHKALAALFAEFQPAWAEVTAEMAAAGVTGGRGKLLTPHAVRRIWKTVCRDVAVDARSRASVEKMPPGWAPVPVATLPAPEPAKSAPAQALAPIEPPGPRPAPPRRPVPSQRPDDPAPVRTPEEIQAELDAVREQLQQDRAWLPGQKRAAPRT
jgi:hypothetical protein